MGKETAEQLIAEGYIVYSVARRMDEMQDLKKQGGNPIKMGVTIVSERLYSCGINAVQY